MPSSSNPKIPAVAVDGKRQRINTMGSLRSQDEEEDSLNNKGMGASGGVNDGIEIIHNGQSVVPSSQYRVDEKIPSEFQYATLREYLKKRGCKSAENDKGCWPDQTLRAIMTPKRVHEELRRMEVTQKDSKTFAKNNGEIDWYVNKIVPEYTTNTDIEKGAENATVGRKAIDNGIEAGRQCFLKIFTILVLCEKQNALSSFINAGLSDNDLPLRFEQDKNQPLDCPRVKAACFRDWSAGAVENFDEYQYRLLIPYFGHPYRESERIRYVEYVSKAKMPWKEIRNTGHDQSREGGYGKIRKVQIYSESHGFQDVDQVNAAGGCFALKEMKAGTPEVFKNEAQMLGMFNNHGHIVKLLMTFSYRGINYLLFPWAKCDLQQYWEENPPPYDSKGKCINSHRMTWLSAQIEGLVSALHTLHNPGHLHRSLSPEEKRYARHGDLKSENILWFGCSENSDGFLAIGDLGISELHRKISRSNQPNTKACTLDWRPPEMEQKGGKVSRSYDIWTLGCLLLEFVCWALGGNRLRLRFEEDRRMVPYLGIGSSIFFDVKKTTNGMPAIMVKECVSKVGQENAPCIILIR